MKHTNEKKRHGNKEQTDSNLRGEGRGITGDNRGASRNIYEGHMDKAKGDGFEGGMWGWVGRWGVVG